jgi:hypothetical protein
MLITNACSYAQGIIIRITCRVNIAFELSCRQVGTTVTSWCNSSTIFIYVSHVHFQLFLMCVSNSAANFKYGGNFIIPTSLVPSPPKCPNDHCNSSHLVCIDFNNHFGALIYKPDNIFTVFVDDMSFFHLLPHISHCIVSKETISFVLIQKVNF